jgi:hypothetical protein
MRLYSFIDLQERRIANNRAQLAILIEKHGFDPGFLLTPNSRRWDADVVDKWVEARRVNTGRRPEAQLMMAEARKRKKSRARDAAPAAP